MFLAQCNLLSLPLVYFMWLLNLFYNGMLLRLPYNNIAILCSSFVNMEERNRSVMDIKYALKKEK